jgi:hypothetical protein
MRQGIRVLGYYVQTLRFSSMSNSDGPRSTSPSSSPHVITNNHIIRIVALKMVIMVKSTPDANFSIAAALGFGVPVAV